MISEPIVLEVSRRIDAPPEKVFDAWLDPEGIGRWLFATPDGKMERVEVEPRVGGRFRVNERRGDELAEHFGTYVEIDRPRRLAFDFATSIDETPTRVTVTIEPDGDGSRITLVHEMDPRWADHADRIRQGWSKILEGLERAIA
jgi:uncharacterized protein YndB with AHSA1/START domain